MNRRRLAALFAATLLVVGCVNQRDAATAAVADAEAALAALAADAELYAPEPFAAARAGVDRLKRLLRDGDTAAIVRAVPQITTQLAALQSMTEQRRAEALAQLAAARTEWTALAEELPPLLNSLQRRVAELGSATQLPAGVNRALLERARKELELLKAAWVRAMTAFAAGRVSDAAKDARESRERAQALRDQLGAGTA